MGVKVEVNKASYRYGPKEKPALREITLRMKPGGCYAVLGPNASGKTTLLKVMTLLYRLSQGTVLYDGRDPWSENVVAYRRRVAYIHEKPVMLRGTVYDNLALGLKLRGMGDEEVEKRVRPIADLLGLNSLLEMNVKGLSAGQRQLVAVARAIAVDPDLLALDEAFSNLDFDRRRTLAELIDELKRSGKTIVLATHDVGIAAGLCDYAFYLEGGVLKLEGSTSKLLGELAWIPRCTSTRLSSL